MLWSIRGKRIVLDKLRTMLKLRCREARLAVLSLRIVGERIRSRREVHAVVWVLKRLRRIREKVQVLVINIWDVVGVHGGQFA